MSCQNRPIRSSSRSSSGGHIIDSLLLPKVLDLITEFGGTYRIDKIHVGQTRSDPSSVVIAVEALSEELLGKILAQIADHGAVPVHVPGLRTGRSGHRGGLPGELLQLHEPAHPGPSGIGIGSAVADQEMDCGICVDPEPRDRPLRSDVRCPASDRSSCSDTAACESFPIDRPGEGQSFGFMSSAVSTEKPGGVTVRQIAADLHRIQR